MERKGSGTQSGGGRGGPPPPWGTSSELEAYERRGERQRAAVHASRRGRRLSRRDRAADEQVVRARGRDTSAVVTGRADEARRGGRGTVRILGARRGHGDRRRAVEQRNGRRGGNGEVRVEADRDQATTRSARGHRGSNVRRDDTEVGRGLRAEGDRRLHGRIDVH